MTIGERIKEGRKFRKMTQKQLAEAAEIATGTVQQYELGKREPRYEILVKIAHALHLSVSSLCDTSPTPIDKLSPESIIEEIGIYQKLDSFLNTLGYEIIDGYQYGKSGEYTLIVDHNLKKLYLLNGLQHKEITMQSIESYSRFLIDELSSKATEIDDTEGWLTTTSKTE